MNNITTLEGLRVSNIVTLGTVAGKARGTELRKTQPIVLGTANEALEAAAAAGFADGTPDHAVYLSGFVRGFIATAWTS